MPHNTTSIYINNSPASFSQNLTAPSKIFKILAPLQRSSFSNANVLKTLMYKHKGQSKNSPSQMTSGSALAQ